MCPRSRFLEHCLQSIFRFYSSFNSDLTYHFICVDLGYGQDVLSIPIKAPLIRVIERIFNIARLAELRNQDDPTACCRLHYEEAFTSCTMRVSVVRWLEITKTR